MLQYADDIAIYSNIERLGEAREILEGAIDKLERNLNGEGLEIEQSKTNIIIFNNRPDRENRLIFKIKGERIGNVRTAKFLGITLDSKLKFNRHLENVVIKTQKSINILRYLCRVSWGMETSTALSVYKAYIRSNMEYGLMVCYPRDRKGREVLEKLQNKGIRVAMGYRNSTPINVMLGEAKIMKIEDRAAGLLARNFWTKIIGYNNKILEARMNRLNNLENRKNQGGSNGSNFLLVDSWREFVKDKEEIAKVDIPGVYKLDYRVMTRAVITELDIGIEKKDNKEMKDEEFIRKYKEKYKVSNNAKVMFRCVQIKG